MWLKVLNGIYGFKQLTSDDYEKLEDFCKICKKHGILNNASFKDMKINRFQGNTGQYWVVYNIPTNEIISVSAIEHLPLQIDAWGEDIFENCWRIGVRHATIPDFRAKFSKGLGNNLQNSFQYRYVFPFQIDEAFKRGAEKIIYTTNTSKNKIDRTNKLFQMDRVIHILAKKGYCKKVASNLNIFATFQNVWEVNPEKWKEF